VFGVVQPDAEAARDAGFPTALTADPNDDQAISNKGEHWTAGVAIYHIEAGVEQAVVWIGWGY
jgi:hypothetical protein